MADLEDVVKKHLRLLKTLPRIKPFYTLKCNGSKGVAQMLAGLGAGFGCVNKVGIWWKLMEKKLDSCFLFCGEHRKPGWDILIWGLILAEKVGKTDQCTGLRIFSTFPARFPSSSEFREGGGEERHKWANPLSEAPPQHPVARRGAPANLPVEATASDWPTQQASPIYMENVFMLVTVLNLERD